MELIRKIYEALDSLSDLKFLIIPAIAIVAIGWEGVEWFPSYLQVPLRIALVLGLGGAFLVYVIRSRQSVAASDVDKTETGGE